jgi:hypothetical protein
MATCVDCGDYFHRAIGEEWKMRCLDCWKSRQPARQRSGARVSSLESELEREQAATRYWRARCAELECRHNGADLESELLAQLPRLLLVAHPDRHGNSQAATKATQWLLSVKARLQ